MHTKLIAIAGTGTRALGYAKGIAQHCAPHSQLVALYDLNYKRMQGFCRLIDRQYPMYCDFAEMLQKEHINTLIVCTPDNTHPELIEMGLAGGLDVVVEKPLAMNREGLLRIRAAEAKYGRKVTVTFNMRFTPYAATLKEILMQRPIGKVHSLNVEWSIDRTHGIEYFHRWHANMAISGGLLVHKGSHHFDLLNWLLDDTPHSVYATGERRVFGDANPFYGQRCSNCERVNSCWAAMKPILEDQDLNPGSDADIFNELYFKAEDEDGYWRDKCCFARDIDIYDTINALINYKSGTKVSYTENTYAPWAGFRLVFNGDDGMLEARNFGVSTRPDNFEEKNYIRIVKGNIRQNINMQILHFDDVSSPHGGGDQAQLKQLFGLPGSDPLGQCADSRAGELSSLIGIAANESIISGKVEKVFK